MFVLLELPVTSREMNAMSIRACAAAVSLGNTQLISAGLEAVEAT
jgi:hypothetical protein